MATNGKQSGPEAKPVQTFKVVCEACNGTGRYAYFGGGPVFTDTREIEQTCQRCSGTGRMKVAA